MKKKPTLESRIMHLESLLTAHASAVKRLNQEKADAIREGQAHIDRLQKELEEQKRRCADLQKESFDDWNEVAYARAEIDKLKADLTTARDSCARLSKQLDSAKNELFNLRSEMEQSVKPWWRDWTISSFSAGFFLATSAWSVLAALILPADKTSKSIDQMRIEIHSLSNAIAMTRVVTTTNYTDPRLPLPERPTWMNGTN